MFEVSFFVKYLHYSMCFLFYLFNLSICFVYLSYCVLFVCASTCFPFTPNIKWWEEPVLLRVLEPGFLWVPDSIEGGGCFSVGEFLFHRGIEGDSWLLIFIQQQRKSMQTNVKQRRNNHHE